MPDSTVGLALRSSHRLPPAVPSTFDQTNSEPPSAPAQVDECCALVEQLIHQRCDVRMGDLIELVVGCCLDLSRVPADDRPDLIVRLARLRLNTLLAAPEPSVRQQQFVTSRGGPMSSVRQRRICQHASRQSEWKARPR